MKLTLLHRTGKVSFSPKGRLSSRLESSDGLRTPSGPATAPAVSDGEGGPGRPCRGLGPRPAYAPSRAREPTPGVQGSRQRRTSEEASGHSPHQFPHPHAGTHGEAPSEPWEHPGATATARHPAGEPAWFMWKVPASQAHVSDTQMWPRRVLAKCQDLLPSRNVTDSVLILSRVPLGAGGAPAGGWGWG